MARDDDTPARVRWARLRFSIIGPLLASPPEAGDLKRRIDELAARPWKHPQTGEALRVSFKTIERWFYAARDQSDPIAALARKVHARADTHPSISAALGDAIARQHKEHPRWTFQLHYATEATPRRRHRLRRSRDAFLRGRPRPRPLAPRLPRELARDPHDRRRVKEAARARHPRRSLAPLLPPAVLPRRDRRLAHPRPLAGVPRADCRARPRPALGSRGDR